MRTNPTSNLSMTIDATDLFERYLYEEEYDEFLGETPIPTLEVSKISFGQTINCPLTNTDNIVLAGKIIP